MKDERGPPRIDEHADAEGFSADDAIDLARRVPSPSRPGWGASVPEEARTWALLAHLCGLAGGVVPLGNIIGPLVIWQTKGKEHAFVAQEAVEALNFQITLMIALTALGALAMVLMLVFVGVLLIPVILLAALGALVLSVLAALEASKGRGYRYPFCLRLVK